MKLSTEVLMFAGICGLVGLSMGGCNGVVDEEAEQTLYNALGKTTLTVFPCFVREGQEARYDATEAGKIRLFLSEAELATVAEDDAEIPITSVWGSNQARMFRGGLSDFRAFIEQRPPSTEYALLTEYLIGAKGIPVGIHVYLLDAGGRPAYVRLLNSHHARFKTVDPRSVADCTTIVLDVLGEDLKPRRQSKTGESAKPRRDSSVTVFPMYVMGKSSKDIRDVMGLMLEKEYGMTDIHVTDAAFERTTPADFDATANEFGEFIKQHPIDAQFALYAEVDGAWDPPRVLEVRAALAGRDGTIVWTDRQTPDDHAFKRLRVTDPMTCCMLIAERLQTQVDHSVTAAKSVGEGRMERLWREKSGTPDEAIRAEIQARLDLFKRNHPKSKVLIYPVRTAPESEEDAARLIVEQLNDARFCQAQQAVAAPRFEIAPSSNEQKRLWDLAKGFRAYLQSDPPDADYALLAEYTVNPRDQKVWTVHTVVCDRNGEWVLVDFQNDHQADFRRIDPRTTEDCAKLVLARLKSCVR